MRRVEPDDLGQIAAWYAARDLPMPVRTDLPETGFIEPGVAAGWLYRTDSNLAFIEGVVTNPLAPAHDRNAALDLLMDRLCAAAAALGHHRVIGYCSSGGVAQRAMKHGAVVLGSYQVVAREVP